MDGYSGGQCPMCGGAWQTPQNWNGNIPSKLPRPENQDWINKLQQVFALEEYSKVQYQADEQKYRRRMPYWRIIPQETRHIEWISGLFKAYGIPANGKVSPVKQTASIEEAYALGKSLEANVIQRYVWLIRNTKDETSQQVLETILLQSRMHYMMFSHALDMGGMGMWR